MSATNVNRTTVSSMSSPEVIVIDDFDSDDCPQPGASKIDRIANISITANFNAARSGPGHPVTSLRPKSEPILSHSRLCPPTERNIDIIDVDDERPVSFQIPSFVQVRYEYVNQQLL